MPINALLVDDEPHAVEALEHLLKAFADVNIIGRCDNGVQAVKTVHELKPDVIFLDIHMPKLDGFDVLDLLGADAPLVIFITAYDEYAVQAFENNAVDYLLKPVSHERLAKTIERIRERVALSDDGGADVATRAANQLLTAHHQSHLPIARILVRDKGDVFVIPVGEVTAIEAADDYVVIHTLARSYIKQDRLNKLEGLLNPQLFCRIHRSCIINLDFLEGIETEGKDNRFANIKGGKQYSISRSGYGRLVGLL